MSTLRSVQLADLLVHVVDGASDDAEEQIEAVRDVLREIEADRVPELLIFNKADVPESRAIALSRRYPDATWVSAKTHEHLDSVIATIADHLRSNDRVITLYVPHERGDVLAAIHREGEVVESVMHDDHVVIRVVVDAAGAARFVEWRKVL